MYPAASAGASRVIAGTVLSTLIASGAASVSSPAWFVHEPLNVTPVVSVLCTRGAVQTTGRLMESAPVVVTVTSLLYQPFRPNAPAADCITSVGAVLSTFTINGDALVRRPASFVQEPLTVVPAVSAVCC